MAAVATMLGITWEATPLRRRFVLLPHARKMAGSKGFSEADVLDAANDPTLVYPSLRFRGQSRHIKGDICAVVDPERSVVITVYLNTVETELRPDQTDVDARTYAASR